MVAHTTLLEISCRGSYRGDIGLVFCHSPHLRPYIVYEISEDSGETGRVIAKLEKTDTNLSHRVHTIGAT